MSHCRWEGYLLDLCSQGQLELCGLRHRWGAVLRGLAPRRAGSRSLRQFSLHTLHLPGAHAGLAAAASSCQLAPASLPPCSCVRLRPLANIVTSGEAQGRMGTPPSSPGPDLLLSNCQATRVPSSCPYLPAVTQCGAAGFSRAHSASAPLSHLLLTEPQGLHGPYLRP